MLLSSCLKKRFQIFCTQFLVLFFTFRVWTWTFTLTWWATWSTCLLFPLAFSYFDTDFPTILAIQDPTALLCIVDFLGSFITLARVETLGRVGCNTFYNILPCYFRLLGCFEAHFIRWIQKSARISPADRISRWSFLYYTNWVWYSRHFIDLWLDSTVLSFFSTFVIRWVRFWKHCFFFFILPLSSCLMLDARYNCLGQAFVLFNVIYLWLLLLVLLRSTQRLLNWKLFSSLGQAENRTTFIEFFRPLSLIRVLESP